MKPLEEDLKAVLRPFFRARGHGFATYIELQKVIGRVARELKREKEDEDGRGTQDADGHARRARAR